MQVSAGLRWDFQQSYGNGGRSYLSLNNFKDNLQPRVGLIWDFTRKGQGKVFINYARFLETPIPLDINFLGYNYAMKGRYAEAIAEYQKSMSLQKESSADLCYMGYALAMSGKRGEALAVLNKLKTTKEYVSPAELAILYIGLGDKEGALAELEKAYSAHDLQMQYLKADPHYDSLRLDPFHRPHVPRRPSSLTVCIH